MVLGMSGCSGGAEDKEPEGSGSPKSASELSMEEVAAVGGDTAAFDETYEFGDGLAIEVTSPEEFSPSRKATTGGESHYVKFEIRLANHTAKKVNPGNVSVTVTSGGGQGGDVIDKKQKMTGPPTRPLAPGDETSWAQGFGILDPQDVAVVVQVGVNRAPVAFTS